MKSKNHLTGQWVTTKTLIKVLGISRDHLYQLRIDSLEEGRHWRDISSKNANRKTYRWHLREIEFFFGERASQTRQI